MRSSLTWYPTVSPTGSPSLREIYVAQFLAASLRGSSITIFLPFNHGSSRSAGGTHVVFPLPGGAVSTTSLFAASARRISPIFSSTGNAMTSAPYSPFAVAWTAPPRTCPEPTRPLCAVFNRQESRRQVSRAVRWCRSSSSPSPSLSYRRRQGPLPPREGPSCPSRPSDPTSRSR